MPKTTDKSSLKPPEMSSLFMMKMMPQIAIAVMEIHLPAGPVMVPTTFSRGPENSVMPPLARARSGLTPRKTISAMKRILNILLSLRQRNREGSFHTSLLSC